MESSLMEESNEDLHHVLNCLRRLSLEELDLEWVEFVWDSQFTESEELPSDFSEILDQENYVTLLEETAQSITTWRSGQQERVLTSNSCNESQVSGGTSIWTSLVAQKVPYKSLIALLYYFLAKGQNLNANEKDRSLCTQSASLYFILLSLPGSGAFKVFHAVLYNKALNTFKLALRLHLVNLESSRKKQGKSKSSQAALDDSDGSDDDSSELLGPEEMRRLTNSLHSVLNHFLFYLSHSSLKRSPESLDHTIGELVDLTHLETVSPKFNFNSPRKGSTLSSLAFVAYRGLEVLCSSSLHGPPDKVCKMICKALLPGVLMVPRGGSDISFKCLSVIREHSLFFLHHLIDILGEASIEAIEIFIQHLANHVPDKAEFRLKTSSTIVALSRCFPEEVNNRILRWLLLWSYTESGSQRLFAVEVMGTWIMESGKNGPAQDSISNKFIFGVLLDRCRDVSPRVRAKAYKILSDITQDAHDDMVEIIRNTFDENRTQQGAIRRKEKIDFVVLLQESSDSDLHRMDPLPGADSVIEFLVQSAADESVFVRRSSLQVMFNIVQISEHLREELLTILARHCRDPSLMIRKQMVSYLTDILKRYDNHQSVIHLWVEGVFPIVMDSELKASEKALECIWEMVFNNLTDHKYTSLSEKNALPWKIIHESENLGMTKYLIRACGIWHKEGLLKPSIFKVIRSHINTENNDRAWFLLAVITNHVPLQNPHFVMEYFNTSIHTHEGVGLYTLLQVLSVLVSSVSRLPSKDQKTLQKDLVLLIERFSLPPELISTAMDVATIVSQLEARTKDGSIDTELYHSNIESWACRVIDLIENETINAHSHSDGDNPRLIRQMFTLGELALIIPKHVKEKHFLFFQNLAFEQSTSKISALAIVTLNKMCVTNEEMAKKIVPAYGRLLDESKDPAIKNNIIYGLSDLCVKYANVVESLLPQMTSCLKDSSSLVKRTTLVTIIHLLQEDYLKIGGGRGTFFLRLVQTLLDGEIKSLTEFFIKHRLLKKSPNVMYQHFIEAIFFYNEYNGHSSYNKFIDSSGVQKMFSIAGSCGKESRMFLYKFMLENMNDEQRFQMTYKLCQDVLGGSLEGHIQINEESRDLLKDVLGCLASDEIKLVSLRSRSSEETEDGEGSDLAGAVAAVAKKTIISQVVKKNIIENIVPIVIALKHKLEESKNPLIDDLMTYLREIMKDYKNEVKEILSGDKRLAHEIEFDLKRWEESQRSRSEEGNPSEEFLSVIPREVKDATLIGQVLKRAIVNFRSRRRTLGDGPTPQPSSAPPRRALSVVAGGNNHSNAGTGGIDDAAKTMHEETPRRRRKSGVAHRSESAAASDASSVFVRPCESSRGNVSKRSFRLVQEEDANENSLSSDKRKRGSSSLGRAISSTPFVHSREKNVSFGAESDLSHISHISAPTPKKNLQPQHEQRPNEDTIGSFRLRRNRTDEFDKVFGPKKK